MYTCWDRENTFILPFQAKKASANRTNLSTPDNISKQHLFTESKNGGLQESIQGLHRRCRKSNSHPWPSVPRV